MNNQSSFDRTLLIPIGVSVFALIGLCVILFAGRFTALRGSVEVIPTATVFQYALIGTEPVLVTTTLEEMATEAPAGTEFPPFSTATGSSFATPDLTTVPTLVVDRTSTPLTLATNPPATRTPTSASTAPFGSGTFDDLDSRMVYNGGWTRQSGVAGAYQNTLHVSGTLGNSIFFRFIGQELRVFFQAAPSLGTIRLKLDETNYDMNEANNNTQIYEWVLPSVTNGTHSVTITHLSGGSVNLDYIIIPEVPTTPTNTATTTP
jgi:hypothetical protein